MAKNEVGFFRAALGELVSSAADAWKLKPEPVDPRLKSRSREHTDFEERIIVEEHSSFMGYKSSRVTKVLRRQRTSKDDFTYGEPAKPESRTLRFAFGLIDGALRVAHAFRKDEAPAKREEPSGFFPPIMQRSGVSEVKPKTHEIEKSLDVIFGSGVGTKKSEVVPDLPLPGSQAVRNVDGLGLAAGRPNVSTKDRNFSLFSLFSSARTPTPNVRKDNGLRSRRLTLRSDDDGFTVEL